MVPFLAAGAGAGVPLFRGTRKNGVQAERLPDNSKRIALRGMVPSPTPKRDHGDPKSIRLQSEGKGKLVRAEGLEPSRTLRSNGFSCPLRLSPPPLDCSKVWGLDYPFTVSRIGFRFSGAARLVSTPSRPFRPGLARDRHFTGFPDFGQFCIAGFPASTQVSRLSPMRLPIPPRPHGFKLARISD